jgi:hypothetical protein
MINFQSYNSSIQTQEAITGMLSLVVFQSYNSSIQTTKLLDATPVPVPLQSYNSSIQTINRSPPYQIVAHIFQSYNSSIQTWVIGLFRTDESEINLSAMSMFVSFL